MPGGSYRFLDRPFAELPWLLLLAAIPEEFEQSNDVLVPYEHSKTAQGSSTPHPRQPPVDPPDPVGVAEADFHRLPLDGQCLGVCLTDTQSRLECF